MARILFTKIFAEDDISCLLNSGLYVDFEEVIAASSVYPEVFSLENKSLIFTSVKAVSYFSESGFGYQNNPVYCVGQKTTQALNVNNVFPKITAKNAEELSEILQKHATEDFVHFCGNLALPTLDEMFQNKQIPYQKVVLYQTELLYPKIKSKYDGLVFFSPSGVRSFARFNSFNDTKIFAIGETTANEIRKFTDTEIFVSSENNLEDLLKIIKSEL